MRLVPSRRKRIVVSVVRSSALVDERKVEEKAKRTEGLGERVGKNCEFQVKMSSAFRVSWLNSRW